ncbi:AIR synthase family protein [Clostridium folliculivorans]|uniref:Hydrogenase n=1 Tax=Clostridium folliculivorans TaxID=2886038 RepID=A0A9W6DBZ5_9CLOT|nr:AIR synthase family protein [Clostridium folliculivorans]GKU26461.1 hydrogenase [Clostridium folliculivorans]GKU31984.1 hydrogenase [Clostridium folliculivorans]
MKSGKLNWDDLKDLINNNKSVKRDEVRVRNGVGEDCSVIDFGEYECVISTDPITGAAENIGRLAVHVNCNDVASCGVDPMAILVTILAPENTTFEEINDVMKQINEETSKINVEIIGGHTEITSAVNRIVVSCTVLGKCISGKAVSTAGAKIGDDIVVTKSLALEGTNIIVNDKIDNLKDVLTKEEIHEAKEYINKISVIMEGKVSGEFGVNSMHDITEGGVLGALWELADASNVGFKVYEDRMPITAVTKKVCKVFNIDPLKLISSGSMIITTKNGEELVKLLMKNGINSTIIGNITNDKGILVKELEGEVIVPQPERDELFSI